MPKIYTHYEQRRNDKTIRVGDRVYLYKDIRYTGTVINIDDMYSVDVRLDNERSGCGLHHSWRTTRPMCTKIRSENA